MATNKLNFSNAFNNSSYSLASRSDKKVDAKTTVAIPADYWDNSPITKAQFNEYQTFETDRIKSHIKEMPKALMDIESTGVKVKSIKATIQQPGDKFTDLNFTKDRDVRNPGTGETFTANTCTITTKLHKKVFKSTVTDMLNSLSDM